MKLVFASDSFKGTISSRRTAELLTQAAHTVFGRCETVSMLIADGGEGTADAVIEACGGEREYVNVHDPLMNTIRTYYGVINHDTAIVEMALASGLGLVPEQKRNPMITTSFGTGELVRAALEKGCRNIVTAIGGSATNDGGTGFARALGIRFLDQNGNELEGKGCELENAAHIDIAGLMPEAKNASFTVMCDVSNPLCGSSGATYVYGRQKGAGDEELALLEAGMVNYRDLIIREFGIDPDRIAGAGAAGGLGTALKVFLNAGMKSGIDTVLDLTEFDRLIEGADLIVTGEGRLDSQSLNGKAVQGIGKRAKAQGIPVAALCGCLGEGYEPVFDHGITLVRTTAEDGMQLSEAMQRAEELYLKAAVKMFREIRNE